MKCIAIDDEPVALSIISQFAKRIEDIDIHLYSDPVIGLEEIKRIKPDLVFLDVEMGGIMGTELARRLPVETSLIFTTAYSEYALDGFELNAIDFLHKPFSFSRFQKAVDKAKELMNLRSMAYKPTFADEEINIKSEYKNIKIMLADIVYVEAMDGYVKIYTLNNKPILSRMSMKNMIDILPTDKFVRIHKSFVVPIHRIASYTRSQVVLHEKNITLPIGRVYIEDFLKQMTLS